MYTDASAGAKLRMCHIFAGHGPMLAGGMADVADMKGMGCDEWDIEQDSVNHQLLVPATIGRDAQLGTARVRYRGLR